MNRAAWVACGLAVACQEEPTSWKDDYAFVWHGEYVSVYGYDRAMEEACGGSFAAIDTHTEAILEKFGTDGSIHYEYRWMSPEFWKGRCPPGAVACTASGEPWTPTVPQMHEITHAVEYVAWDNACPSILKEGLAEYFAGPQYHDDELPDPSMVRNTLIRAPISGAEYTAAGHFVSFLVEEFGFEAIHDLCRAVPFYSSTHEDWERAAQKILGLTLDGMLAMYENYPLCTEQQYAARTWECAGEPDVIYMGEKMTFYVETNCANERVMGPIGGKALTIRRVWFPTDGLVEVMVWQADPLDQLRLFMTQECVPCSAEPQVFRTDGLPPYYPFRAGMHEFIFAFDLDQTEPLEVRLGPPVGP
jgi:hypothetical protein